MNTQRAEHKNLLTPLQVIVVATLLVLPAVIPWEIVVIAAGTVVGAPILLFLYLVIDYWLNNTVSIQKSWHLQKEFVSTHFSSWTNAKKLLLKKLKGGLKSSLVVIFGLALAPLFLPIAFLIQLFGGASNTGDNEDDGYRDSGTINWERGYTADGDPR
jgi:hypothetical protein